MASFRNKQKLAAVTRETQEEHPRNDQSRNTSVPRINEQYITQVSEKIEGRVTKKLSQDFSRTESRILGALSKLDELEPTDMDALWNRSGNIPKQNVESQGTNEDDSQSDPHPEAGIFHSQRTQNFGPEVGDDAKHWFNMTFSIICEKKSGKVLKIFGNKSLSPVFLTYL